MCFIYIFEYFIKRKEEEDEEKFILIQDLANTRFNTSVFSLFLDGVHQSDNPILFCFEHRVLLLGKWQLFLSEIHDFLCKGLYLSRDDNRKFFK